MTRTYSSARAAERPRAPHKGPQAFRTISEVAGELDVPAHVLRFWESRFTQVHPLKRGGGRRYYRPEDIALLKGIRRLLYDEGLTVKGAQKVMRERGARFVAGFGAGETQAPAVADQDVDVVADGGEAPAGNDRPRPLLTPEKRASLEAALALLHDLRAELSVVAADARARAAERQNSLA